MAIYMSVWRDPQVLSQASSVFDTTRPKIYPVTFSFILPRDKVSRYLHCGFPNLENLTLLDPHPRTIETPEYSIDGKWRPRRKGQECDHLYFEDNCWRRHKTSATMPFVPWTVEDD